MSSKPAVESAAASSQIVDLILLSGLLTATYGAFTNKKYNYSFILLMGVMTALSDEFLQGFIEGRSSEVRDVLIDFSGVAAFIVVFRVFIYNKIFSSMNY